MTTAVVMGLGASGRGALELLGKHGFRRIGVDLRTDVAPIEGVELQLGPHRRETFTSADLIVVSPGIPLKVPDLQAAREAGVEVLGEIGLAERYALKDRPRVGITGTNGKSTVTHFTGQLLADLNPFVGGNLGNPASRVTDEGAYVLELSSYQLESAGDFRADVGMILNLTPDHLARHKTMEGYAAAKARLFRNARPTDVALIPVGDPYLNDGTVHGGERAWIGGTPGLRREGDAVHVVRGGDQARFDLGGFSVPGEHNKDNAACALFAAWCLTGDVDGLQARVAGLTALEHRMQVVHRGRCTWIDDSKSTNVDSTLAALRGRTASTVLLLGGEWKGTGFASVAASLGAVHTVICFGANGPDIASELEGALRDGTNTSAGASAAVPTVITVGGMHEAMERARQAALDGDEVLLSPGCASFDEFDNFAHRGRVFAAWVRKEAR